ncbi:MAG: amidase, partial [Verrucomicrobiota bacterium]
MSAITDLTISELQAGFRRGDFTPADAVRALEDRIATVDPSIGAYLSRDFDTALAAADKADISLPLGGVPIGIKDAINVLGESCTCSSKMLAGYKSPYDATVIGKLRAAGAIPFGRLNMDEFAMGSSTEN